MKDIVMLMTKYFLFLLFFFTTLSPLFAEREIRLRENLTRAMPGDFIVTAQNKTYTLFYIKEKSPQSLAVEEVSVPAAKMPNQCVDWRSWLETGASNHTAWIRYEISLATGTVLHHYSFSRNEWYAISQDDNFLSTLLNLRLKSVPLQERKRVGPKSPSHSTESRRAWQPRMVVDGKIIEGVQFDEWRTTWPRDGSELAGRTIELFIPEDSGKYPSYFPYWLQISGMIGKAKIRIIDSGSHLTSPSETLYQNCTPL